MLPQSHISRIMRGFTLVEMLVVILILAILLSIALPLYQNTIQDSTKKAARTNMQTIATALAAYQIRNPTHNLPLTMEALYAPPSDLSAVAGPGNRTYIFITTGSCYTPMLVTGAYQVANYTLLPGQFAVESINNGVTSGASSATTDDWCYVPGVSVE